MTHHAAYHDENSAAVSRPLCVEQLHHFPLHRQKAALQCPHHYLLVRAALARVPELTVWITSQGAAYLRGPGSHHREQPISGASEGTTLSLKNSQDRVGLRVGQCLRASWWGP
eukprot:1178869-Prorocentrum_minimum.AAC.1